MTATTDATTETPGRGNATPSRNGVALDLTYGSRGPATCICGRHLPRTTTAVFEVETIDGTVLCSPCLDKAHRPLRVAVLLLQTIANATDHGDQTGAEDAIRALKNGLDLRALEQASPKPSPRPTRQPARRNTRRRRG